MRLVFDATGALREFHTTTPSTAGPGSPMVTIDVDLPDYFVAGVKRATERNRVTYSGGKVCLDGTPYTPPTIRTPVSYSTALAAIGAATTVAQLKEILYRVCDEFLGLGALEL
jgi:hypothetical protein